MSVAISSPVRPSPPQSPAKADLAIARPWWTRALGAVSNLVVFALLGGVLYIGHRTGWKLPKVSELTGTAAVAVDDWCTEHLVPESQCIECREELLPKSKLFGFCRQHGVAECVIDHPELYQVDGDAQLPKYDTVRAIAVIDRPENNSRNTMHVSRVQFASANSVAKAGIDVDVVQERPMTDALTANGELVFDPTHVGHLNTRVSGTVASVFKTIGDPVAADEVLALVDAAQVGAAKSQLLQAIVQLQLRRTTVARLRPLSATGAVPERTRIEAESAMEEAEVALITAQQALANLGLDVPDEFEKTDPRRLAHQLRFLGIPSEVTTRLPANTRTANLIPIRATFDGVLVASDVVAGEVVEVSKAMFTISDPKRMWLVLNVREEDAPHVCRGLPVRFQPENGREKVTGTIDWISPAIDEHTRTLQVRIVVNNKEGALRDKTFGTGRIILREEPHAVVVPREAVQSTADAHFVFVRDKHYFDKNSPKFFHVRQVRTGATDADYVELLAGALPGEIVVSKGSHVLLAQLLRSSLGAGCDCHHH